VIMSDDMRLVHEFAATKSEPAFAALVERYIGLVHSAALRQAGNEHVAEEITQAVFIILARKAASLRPETVLAAWLYRATRYATANLLRASHRRHTREQEVYMQSTLNEPSNEPWTQLAPLLDDEMNKLGEIDRAALVLRYFENKSSREIAAVLRMEEDAAQKRVARALEKLRDRFAKRGVTMTATVIAGAVSANSVQAAPIGLATTVTAAAAKGIISGSTLTIVNGTLKIMAWTKTQTVIVASTIALLAAGSATVAVRHWTYYSWQVSKFNYLPVDAPTLLFKTPPQVRILKSKYSYWVEGTPFTEGDSAEMVNGQMITHTNQSRSIGIGVMFQAIVMTAYHSDNRQTIFSAPMPKGRYDFIANLPQNALPVLQEEIKRKFGLVGKWELVETNVLSLRVARSDSSKFRSSADFNDSLKTLLGSLKNMVGGSVPIIDETGFTNRFEFTFTWPVRRTADDEVYLQTLNSALQEQLGLELVPNTKPIEMLVVRKIN
jgi:RNA polymerase sigma factor (sigma-70 family)